MGTDWRTLLFGIGAALFAALLAGLLPSFRSIQNRSCNIATPGRIFFSKASWKSESQSGHRPNRAFVCSFNFCRIDDTQRDEVTSY